MPGCVSPLPTVFQGGCGGPFHRQQNRFLSCCSYAGVPTFTTNAQDAVFEVWGCSLVLTPRPCPGPASHWGMCSSWGPRSGGPCYTCWGHRRGGRGRRGLCWQWSSVSAGGGAELQPLRADQWNNKKTETRRQSEPDRTAYYQLCQASM